MGTENDSNEARSDSKSEISRAADANDYVIELGISKLDGQALTSSRVRRALLPPARRYFKNSVPPPPFLKI